MLGQIIQGVPTTLALVVGSLLIGVIGGVPLLMARRSRLFLLAFLARAAIELFRGVPPIVWLFFVYFGLSKYVLLDPVPAAIIGLGVISAAYMAEIYRGGLSAVSRGQWEAAAALNLSPVATLRHIIGPQVLRISVPAAATYAIGLLKDSSVAFTIGATDILFQANAESRLTNDPLVPFLFAAGVYIVLTVPCAWASRRLDSVLRQRVAA